MVKMAKERTGYELSLCGDSSWRFASSPKMAVWLSRLARIMRLKEASGGCNVQEIFIREMSESDGDPVNQRKIFCNDHLSLWAPSQGGGSFFFEMKTGVKEELQYLQMWFSLEPVYWEIIKNGGLPFHAALVEADGQGLVFAGHGNAGKSTIARRLRHIWNPLCDDEVLVLPDIHKSYLAHPFPTWSEYMFGSSLQTWDVERSVPLQAILFIEKSQRDGLVLLDSREASVLITQSSVQVCHKFWKGMDLDLKRRFARRIFDNACNMAKSIPAYTLYISPTDRFWELLTREGLVRQKASEF